MSGATPLPSETTVFLENAFHLARRLGIKTLLIQLRSPEFMEPLSAFRTEERIGWIVMDDMEFPKPPKTDTIIPVPHSPLTRVSQMRVGLFLAVAQDFVDVKESVVALSGAYGSDLLDTVMVLSPSRDLPWYHRRAQALSATGLSSRTIERVVSCALRLAAEGREGRSIGCIFAIGNMKELRKHTQHLILNPLKGHPPKARSMHNPEFFETLRELTALDGAFLVSPTGTVEAAGVYLGAPARNSHRLVSGLGARHAAAAGLTSHCPKSLAVVISESSGTVSVFQAGGVILKLEKVMPLATNRTFKARDES